MSQQFSLQNKQVVFLIQIKTTQLSQIQKYSRLLYLISHCKKSRTLFLYLKADCFIYIAKSSGQLRWTSTIPIKYQNYLNLRSEEVHYSMYTD